MLEILIPFVGFGGLLAIVIAMGVLWDVAGRRRAGFKDRCPCCGYSRHGLNTGTPCPECASDAPAPGGIAPLAPAPWDVVGATFAGVLLMYAALILLDGFALDRVVAITLYWLPAPIVAALVVLVPNSSGRRLGRRATVRTAIAVGAGALAGGGLALMDNASSTQYPGLALAFASFLGCSAIGWAGLAAAIVIAMRRNTSDVFDPD